MLLIAMLFNGSTLADYVIKTFVYNMKDTIGVLCIPGVGAMTVFMMRTYIKLN